MVLYKGSDFKPVVCDGCGVEITNNLTEVSFFEHEKGYKKPKLGDCNDEICKKERDRTQSLCSVCAKKIPSVNKKNVCCGHTLRCLYEIETVPDWLLMACADCSMVHCENTKTGEVDWVNNVKKRPEYFSDSVKKSLLRLFQLAPKL